MNRTLRWLLPLALLAAVPAAQAAFIAEEFQPSASDFSVQWLLSPMLGPLVADIMGSGSGSMSPFLAVVAWTLSHIVVPLGGVLLLYSTYMGISHSSMHAELFGDKRQAYWVAVRTVLAFGMVAPAPGLSGLALVNVLLMSLTLHGVGAASSLWGVAVDALTKTPVIMSDTSAPTRLWDAMLRQAICAAGYNAAMASDQGQPVADWTLTFQTLSDNDTETRMGWKSPTHERGNCGQIIIKKTGDLGTFTISSLTSFSTMDTATASVRTSMQSEAKTVLDHMQSQAKALADSIVAASHVPGASMPEPEYYRAEMAWAKLAIQSAAQNIASTAMPDITSAFTSAAKSEGWGTAGMYFLALSGFQQAVNRAAAMGWVDVTESAEDTLSGLANETLIPQAMNYLTRMNKYIDLGHSQLGANSSMPAGAEDAYSGFGGNILASVGKAAMDLATGVLNSSAMPLTALATISDWLVISGWALIGGGAAVSVGAVFGGFFGGGFAGAISAVKGASGVASYVAMIGGCGIVVGLLGYVVCLFPTIYWAWRLLHWWLYVMVSQFAGGAWLILHAHPDGSGIAGSASGGYSMALNLTLRPVFDIVSLVTSLVAMVVGGQLIAFLTPVMVKTMGSGTLVLFSVVLLVILEAGVIIWAMKLPAAIEKGVLDYIGGRGSDMEVDEHGNQNRMLAMMALMRRNASIPKMPGRQDKKDNKPSADLSGGERSAEARSAKTNRLLPHDGD